MFQSRPAGFFRFYYTKSYLPPAPLNNEVKVSIPSSGIFSFLLIGLTACTKTVSLDGVSIPSSGIFSFLQRCQQARALRRARVKNHQHTRRTYLLNGGLLVCAHCGLPLRAQSSTHGIRYYRDTARDRGASCPNKRRSVRADDMEAQVGFLIQHLHLPTGWEAMVEAMLDEEKEQQPDPRKESAKLQARLKRLRKLYANDLYDGEEAAFWREVEKIQTRLKVLERMQPSEVQASAVQLLNIAEAWQVAEAEERRELVQMLFQKVVVNIPEKRIVEVYPKPEYLLLFRTIPGLHALDDGGFRIENPFVMADSAEA